MRGPLPLLGALLLTCLLAGCPQPPPPGPPGFTVTLLEAGPRPDAVVAAVRSLTGYQEPIARKLVERAGVQGLGVPVGADLPEAEARARAAALEAAGARVTLVQVPR